MFKDSPRDRRSRAPGVNGRDLLLRSTQRGKYEGNQRQRIEFQPTKRAGGRERDLALLGAKADTPIEVAHVPVPGSPFISSQANAHVRGGCS